MAVATNAVTMTCGPGRARRTPALGSAGWWRWCTTAATASARLPCSSGWSLTGAPPSAARSASFVRLHEVGERPEQAGGVVRAGCGLGVVLHGEGGYVEAAQAFDDAVVEVDVAHFDTAEGSLGGTVGRSVDGEAVVVAGH